MEEINETNELELRKGIIYCIVCNVTGEKYYGSTFRNLLERIKEHKSQSNKTASKQIIERGNYSIQILMECYVPNKLELRKMESNFIRNNECINKFDAHLSRNEILQYQKDYYENNKEKKYQYNKEYQPIYRIKNCESIRIKQNIYH